MDNADHIKNNSTEYQLIENHLQSPTLMMLILIAVLGVLLYGSFLLNPANRGDFLPYILAITAETFLLYQALLSLWTTLASGFNPRTYQFYAAQSNLVRNNKRTAIEYSLALKPKLKHIFELKQRPVLIDVFVTTYGENPDVIRKTVQAAKNILGRHSTYILDDGRSNVIKNLADELKVNYIRRENNIGAKAGNINNALKLSIAEYFVIFDADFIPDSLFLYETLPFFENDNIAFVQTPQHYNNLDNLISTGAGFMQHLFYSMIQPGKNKFNSAFCVGTNVIFRRTAIDTIGGMYQKSKSEDVWTSLLLHEQGFQSVYIPNVLAIGKTPETIKSFTMQQLRWATGAFEIFFNRNPLWNKNLTVDQRLQYFGTATYYFNGLAAFLLLMLPPIQIFFNLSPVNLHISPFKWAIYYSGFYVMQILVAFYTMGGFKFQTLLLSNTSFPIYIKAMRNVFLKKDQVWHATGGQKTDSPFNYIIPQVLVFVFLLATTFVGIWKANYTSNASLSIFWNAINTLILGVFIMVAFKESIRIRKPVVQTNKLIQEKI